MSPGLADALTECIETWATTQLYSILICKTRDLEHDKKLYDLLASLAFLSPHNLEIAPKYWSNPKWQQAVRAASEHLFTITKHKAPLQKLMVIQVRYSVEIVFPFFISFVLQRSCQMVLDALLSQDDSAGGADTLLPALVFVLISANPPQLWTSIQFIRDFRNKSFKVPSLIDQMHFDVLTFWFFHSSGDAIRVLFGVARDYGRVCGESDGGRLGGTDSDRV